jgi:hypothetical protein
VIIMCSTFVTIFSSIVLTENSDLSTLNDFQIWFIGIGLAYQGKDIVFRFIIEYSSLMDYRV